MLTQLLTSALLVAPPCPLQPNRWAQSTAAAHVIDVHRAADAFLASGHPREAQAAFARALALRPDDPTLTYGLTCALARLGKTDEALSAFERAMDLGYRDACLAFRDPDLRSLKAEPRFQNALPEGWKDPQPDAQTWTFGSGTRDALLIPTDPARFAHAVGDGSLNVRSCENGEVLMTTDPVPVPIASLGVNADGSLLAALYADGRMMLHSLAADVATALEPANGVEPAYWTGPLAFAAEGSVIVAHTNNGPLLWSTGGRFLGPVEPENAKRDGWRTCELSGTGWLPEIVGASVHLHTLDPQTDSDKPSDRTLTFPHDVSGFEFSADGRHLAVGTSHGGVHLVEVSTGATLWSQVMTDSATGSATDVFGSVLKVPILRFDPNAERLAVCTTTGYFVGLFDMKSGEQLWRTGHLGGRMGGAMPLFQNERLVVGDDGWRAWDGASGKGLFAETSGEWRKRLGRAFAAVEVDVLFSGDEAFHRISAVSRETVWRVDRPRQEPWLIEHPSGWVAGRFEAAEAGVSPERFDPKRIRLAAEGVPLFPPPQR